MASLGSATNTVLDTDFVMTVGLVIAGSWLGEMASDFARANIMDVGFPGGDIAYALAASLVALAFLPRKFAYPLSLGMVSGSAQSELEAEGVL